MSLPSPSSFFCFSPQSPCSVHSQKPSLNDGPPYSCSFGLGSLTSGDQRKGYKGIQSPPEPRPWTEQGGLRDGLEQHKARTVGGTVQSHHWGQHRVASAQGSPPAISCSTHHCPHPIQACPSPQLPSLPSAACSVPCPRPRLLPLHQPQASQESVTPFEGLLLVGGMCE